MSEPLPRLLHPAFWHWQRQPAEMFGFWHWTGSEDLRETVHRTGANATSFHLPLHLLRDERARYGVRPLPAPVQVSTRCTMDLEFDAPTGLAQVNLLVSTSNSHAKVVGELFALKPSTTPLARAQTEPRSQPHLILQPAKPLPAGRYRVHIQVRKSQAHVWLARALQEGTRVRLGDLTLRAWGIIGEWRDAGGSPHPLTRSSRHDTPVPLGTSTLVTLANLRVDSGAGIGEHNNAFFVVYPDWFWQMYPQAAMRDREGNIIRAGENPWIAFDDPVLTDATLRQMRETVPLLRGQKRVRYWVIGGEQGYPDYFGLPEGDFRPEFLAHYRAWLEAGFEPTPPAPFPAREGGDTPLSAWGRDETKPNPPAPFPAREGGDTLLSAWGRGETEPNPPAPFPAREGGDTLLSAWGRDETKPNPPAPFPAREGGDTLLSAWGRGETEPTPPAPFPAREGGDTPLSLWERGGGRGAEQDRYLWRRFREAAVTERFALYTTALRQLDPTRPIFIPTHGNPFALDFRGKMGFPIADLAGAADGFEAGPISIDEDAERIHRLTLDMQTGFGVPVVAPRLANKQLSPTARGGGRSFSPQSARRAVYEALGLGVWHIGLVQWRGSLPDGEWGIQGTPAEAECKRLFEELKRAAPWLEGCSRLHPQVGIFLSDATWQRWWQDRWSLLYDLSCSRGWNTLFVHDAQCDASLAQAVPVLLSVDNPVLSRKTHRALSEYLQAGGKILAVGALAERDEDGNSLPPLQEGVIRLPDDAPGAPVTVIHQTSTDRGAATWSAKVRPLPVEEMERQLEQIALLRPIEVTSSPETGWAKGVECLLLTDGTNLVVLLLHRGDFTRALHLSLSARLLEVAQGVYRVRDALTGEVLSPNLPVRVTLEAYGTRLLVIERQTTPSECERAIAEAEKTCALWRNAGVDTAPLEWLTQSARAHLQTQRLAKSLALARSVTHALAIKAAAHRAGENLHVQASVWQPDGKPADGAQVRVRLVPDAFRWWDMQPQGKGRYATTLRLPRLYSPMKTKYTPVTQGLMLILEARLGRLFGGERLAVG